MKSLLVMVSLLFTQMAFRRPFIEFFSRCSQCSESVGKGEVGGFHVKRGNEKGGMRVPSVAVTESCPGPRCP